MKLSERSGFLHFIDQMECDGTIYLEIPKSLVSEAKEYHQTQLQKFNKLQKDSWVLRYFFNEIPIMSLLIFGKKTKIKDLNLRWVEVEDFYEISFNFWDLMEFHPKDEYTVIESYKEFFKHLNNYVMGGGKISLIREIKDEETIIVPILFVDNENRGEVNQLKDFIYQNNSTFHFLCVLNYYSRRIGLNTLTFDHNWI